MESLKETLASLSESQKIDLILSFIEKNSGNNSKESSQSLSPEKSDPHILQKRVFDDDSPDKNESGSTKKKQRTLDDWLIKRDSYSHKNKQKGSPHKNKQTKSLNKDNESSCPTKIQENISTSDATNKAEGSSSSNCVSIHNKVDDTGTNSLNNIPNGNIPYIDAKHKNNKSEEVEINSVENGVDSPSVKTTALVKEKYNLRPKKKVSKLSVNDNFMKYKNVDTNQSDFDKNLNSHKRVSNREKENDELNESLLESQATECSTSTLSKSPTIFNGNDSSDVQLFDKDSNSHKRTSRGKRKNHKMIKSLIESQTTECSTSTLSKSPTILNGNDSSCIQHFSNDSNSRKRTSRGEREIHKSLIDSQTTEYSTSTMSKSPIILNRNDSNDVQLMEMNEDHTSNNLNVSSEKVSSNHKIKKKKDFFNKPSAACYSDCVVNENLNNQILSQSNEQVLMTSTSQFKLEAFCKLRDECAEASLNIKDILCDKRIQDLLSDQDNLNNEAVVFLGSFKSSIGEILPVVHVIESQEELLESICKLHQLL